MSSPTTTVNAVMQWLMGLFKLWLPTLPLSGVWARFRALWELPVPGQLPDPTTPLPWNIGVEPDWSIPLGGVRLIPAGISILVQQAGGSPAIEVPLRRRRKAKRAPGRPSRQTTKKSSKSKSKRTK